MKKKLRCLRPGIIVLIFGCMLNVNAQTPVIVSQRTLGGTLSEQPNAMVHTGDGGYILAGEARSKNGDLTGVATTAAREGWVIKMDKDFAIVWQKVYPGHDISSVAETKDGGSVLTGTSRSIPGGFGGSDMFITKLDAVGNIQWEKPFGGSDEDYGQTVKVTSDGGYVAVGITSSVNGQVTGNHGGEDIWVVKLDVSGNIQWQKTLGGSSSDQVDIPVGNKICETPEGGYVIAGFTYSSDGDIPDSRNAQSSFIAKLDAAGNKLWANTYGNSGWGTAPASIKITLDEKYIVTGRTTSAFFTGYHGADGSYDDAFVMKLDTDGQIIWQRAYGGAGSESGWDVAPQSDGGYVMTAQANSYDGDVSGELGGEDAWVVKLDAVGNIVWQKIYGGSGYDYGRVILENADGNLVLLAQTASGDHDVVGFHKGTSQFHYDFWLVKLAPCPTYVKDTINICPGGSYNFNGTDITAAGTYKDTLQTYYGCDSIIELTAQVFATTAPAIAANNNLLTATSGYTAYQWLLDGSALTGATNTSLTYSLSGNYTVRGTDANGCEGVSAPYTVVPFGSVAQEGAMVVPNPVKDFVTIRFPNAIASFYISIVNMEGKKVGLQSFANTNSPRLDVRKLPAGVYLLRLSGTDGAKASYKMIKGK